MRYRHFAEALAIRFLTLYRDLGFKGASSHSGRRTFITKAAKRCIEGGGSLRDVQQLAGHSSLATTQRYIEGSSDAKRRIVDLISQCAIYLGRFQFLTAIWTIFFSTIETYPSSRVAPLGLIAALA